MKTPYAILYNEDDRRVMQVAEDSLDPGIDRVDEIIGFAAEAGIDRIGIANCITFEREAEQLEKLLESKGYKVFRANCKLGRMPNSDILPGYKGISCNPAGQAKELEEHYTQLNLVLGLCVGHDMIFNKKSKALTTTLIIKDRKLMHHTLLRFKQD